MSSRVRGRRIFELVVVKRGVISDSVGLMMWWRGLQLAIGSSLDVGGRKVGRGEGRGEPVLA